jgi:nucleotide-binding universal stress UspA family protein
MQEQAKASSDYSNQSDTSSALLTDDRGTPPVRLAAAQTNGERGVRLKKILVATDFSVCSTHAVKCAVAIATLCHAKLTLLHVIDINAQTREGSAEQLMELLWRQASTRMRELASSFSGQVDVQTVLDEGLPWDSLVERSSDFDLLIVAENRSKGRWKPFSHHTAERVMESAHCPVLIIPEPRASI